MNFIEFYLSLAAKLLRSPCFQDLPRPIHSYEYLVINWGATDRPHCDPKDCGLTMILILTDKPCHFLALPELRVKVEIGDGYVIALASAYLDHFVTGLRNSKDRRSLLFITQLQTARWHRVNLPPLH